jgi:hypothetical protein
MEQRHQQARKTGSAAQIQPSGGIRRRESDKLRRIQDVALPKGVEGRLGNEILTSVLGAKQLREKFQALNCFTWNI